MSVDNAGPTASTNSGLTTTTPAQVPTPPTTTIASVIRDQTILERIFSVVLNTDRKALTTCVRVSKHFHAVATPLLYSRVRLGAIPPTDSRRDATDADADENLSRISAKRYNPVTSERKKRLLEYARIVRVDAHYLNFCRTETGTEADTDIVGRKPQSSASGSNSHGGSVSIVNKQTIREVSSATSKTSSSHSGQGTITSNIHSLRFPNIKTLVIHPLVKTIPEEGGPSLHAEHQHDWPRPKDPKTCSVIGDLVNALDQTQLKGHQTKIVLNTIVPNRFDLFPPGLPKDTYDNIDQLTLVAPVINFRFGSTSPDNLPSLPKLKKLVFIFKTPDPNIQWKLGTHNMFGWGGLHDFFGEDFRYLVDLVWKLEDQTTPVCIVNADRLYHLHVGLRQGATSEAVQGAFEAKFRQSLSYCAYTVEHDHGQSWAFSDSEGSDDGRTPMQKVEDEMMEEMVASITGGVREYKRERDLKRMRKESERAIRKRDRPERHQREKDEKERLRIKLDNIRYITMDEYLACHDWEGEIDPEDAVKWRKAEQAASAPTTAATGKGKEKGKRKQAAVELEVEVELDDDGNLMVGSSSSKR
ncbi:hypothetical protein I316_00473 [Kwoniella heveanensis BCC8398]|uniref:Uncharacterized protein n=1 Tax=Kwoniella heveanensis BCC8398 TaxID=1296120 RepID=A0A1B9H242_9TREE|nr:hypothetical protein I316_00473 [Kwoniella heveanensis BCC8398]